MGRRRDTAWALTAIVCATIGYAAAGHAEGDAPSQAETLFRQGREAMKAGDYTTACPRFEESQRLEPANGTLLNLALCEESLGKTDLAREHLRQVLAASDLDDQRRAIATEHARTLEQSALRTGAPPPAAEETPGQRPPEPTTREPEPAPAPAVRRDAQTNPARPPHAAVYILGGFGLLSLTTAAVTGVLVIDRGDTVDAHCPNKLCDDEGLAAASSGRTLSTVATATFGVGVALTALSVYFLLSDAPSTPRTGVAIGSRPGGGGVSWIGEF